MEVRFSKDFVKSYEKRIAGNQALVLRFLDRLEKFRKDHTQPILRDHALGGRMKGSRSFAINGDIRVIYRVDGVYRATFLDIGSHNQVY